MKTELRALIDLLEDPDPQVFQSLKTLILAYGTQAIEDLENAGRKAVSEEHLYRIEYLISELLFRDIRHRMRDWIISGGTDIHEGYKLVAELIHSDSRHYTYKNLFSEIRNEAWLELNNKLTALEKTMVVNHFFYDKYQLQIDTKNPALPARYSLSRLASDKLGNEESLLAAYTVVARGLDLPIFGVQIPGLSLLAYLDLPFIPRPGFDPSNTPILFFIHPGEKGRIFGIEEVRFFLSKFYPDLVSQEVRACTDTILLRNYIRSLAKSCMKAGKNELESKLFDLLNLWKAKQ